MGTYSLSAGYYGRYYLKALKVRTLVRRDFQQAFKDFDVLASPTMPTVAPRLGELSDPLTMYMADVNTVPVNLAGIPAISVPCGTAEGMPVGLQLIGDLLCEPVLLRTASAYEHATGSGDGVEVAI
jgi:aspartyl-tRNA(Asn)/glutamyl-tRNA(Gln) amidotransferase subunit A